MELRLHIDVWKSLAPYRPQGLTPWKEIRDRLDWIYREPVSYETVREFEILIGFLDSGAVRAQNEHTRREMERSRRNGPGISSSSMAKIEREARAAEDRGEIYIPPVCSGDSVIGRLPSR